MSKVLVCTVGGSTEPIVNAILQNKPQYVYFLCSGGKGENASSHCITNETQRIEKGECPECKKKFQTERPVAPIAASAKLDPSSYKIVEIANPDDLLSVLKACESVRSEIASGSTDGNPEIIANYSGGTKTMSLGLGLYAVKSDVQWDLQVQAGHRPDLVKISAGDISHRQDLSMLVVADAKQFARTLAEERYDFEGASAVVAQVTREHALGHQDKLELSSLHVYYEMKAAWDRFDYGEALSFLTTAAMPIAFQENVGKDWLPKLKQLNRAKDVLTNVSPCPKQDKSPGELLEDLIANAKLCARRQRYDDAVSRLYRATELLAQIRLKQAYNINSGDVDLDDSCLPPQSKVRLTEANAQSSASGRKIKIGLMESFVLLHDMNDPLGAYWHSGQDKLKHYLEQRNQSYLAHGFKPVTGELWTEVGEAWLDWLQSAIKSQRPIAERSTT